MSKAPAILLLLTLGMWAVIGVAAAIDEDPYARALPHPQHAGDNPAKPSMMVSGERARLDGPLWYLGLLLASSLALFVPVTLTMVTERGRAGAGVRRLILISVIPWILLLVALFVSYRGFAVDGERRTFMSFPLPTALMLPTWAASIVLIVIYVCGFRRWFVTDEQMRRFGELLDEKKRETGGEERS